MNPKFTHLKGLPSLGDLKLPPPDADTSLIGLALIELLKETHSYSIKETLRRVFIVLDGVTFTCGKIEMKTEQLKALIQEAIK